MFFVPMIRTSVIIRDSVQTATANLSNFASTAMSTTLASNFLSLSAVRSSLKINIKSIIKYFLPPRT